MEKAVTEQEKLKLWDTPKLTIKVLSDKMASLDREVIILINICLFLFYFSILVKFILLL